MPAKKTVEKKPAALVATPTPSLVLNLTSFSPITPTSGIFCQLGKADPTNPIPQISVVYGNPPSDPSVELYNANVGGNNATSGGVRVKKMADLSFGLNPVGLMGGPFFIVGLTIVPLTGALADDNISKAKWTPSAVAFTVRKGNKGARWKFYVSIMDNNTKALGIIDPEIENDVSAVTPAG